MSIATDITPRPTHPVDVINNNGNATEIERVNLADYFFSPDPFSSAFNWRAIALTLEGWNNLSEEDHHSFLITLEQEDNPDPQVLVLNYREIDLWIVQGIRGLVVWHGPGKVLCAGSKDPGVNTPTELPTSPIELLRVLEMTADPLADEVIQLWEDLIAMLPRL
jgi:hypothetical protein